MSLRMLMKGYNQGMRIPWMNITLITENKSVYAKIKLHVDTSLKIAYSHIWHWGNKA
jgi:hypothetical protein